MADLTDTQAAQSVKIAGADPATGVEDNFMKVDSGGRTGVKVHDHLGNGIDSIMSAGINTLTVAQSATNYVLSTANTTVAQLAVGSTFTGGIETTFNQQSYSILVTSDQIGILTINNYIDAAGTFVASTQSFNIKNGVGFARSGPINGNYFNLTFTNIGQATTTTLNINTAHGTIQSASALNNLPISLDETNGIPLTATPYGNLQVSLEASALFSDTFDSAGFDVVDRWNTPVVASGGGHSQSLGVLNLITTTAASSAVSVSSKYSFTSAGISFLNMGVITQVEASILTNTHRFWGFGTPNPSYTALTPLLNAIGFEIDTSGNLNAVIYSNGIKVYSYSLNKYKVYITGTSGVLAVVIRADSIYWYIGTTALAATSSFLVTPDVFTLPLRFHVINHTTPPSPASTMKLQALGVGDSGRNGIGISDGLYQWRKATVKLGNIAPTAADTALVVTLSPTSAAQLPAAGSGFSFGQITTTSNVDTVKVDKTPYTEQVTNATRSIASSSVNDTSAGTGAGTVAITYLDSTGAGPYTTTVTLNGTSYVNTAVSDICFIEKIIVTAAGSGGVNAGTLTLKASTAGAGATIGTIVIGDNQSMWGHHYVPLGKISYISGFSFSSSSTTVGAGAVFVLKKQKPTVTASPLIQISDTCTLAGSIASTTTRIYNSTIQVSGPARVAAYTLPASSTSTIQRASFDYIDN